MDFEIAKTDLSTALRQILQGRKPDSNDVVDMTAGPDTLTVVVTGRSIEVPIEALERGSYSIPVAVLSRVKKISGTYDEPKLRIRVSEGRFRLQGMTTSHPAIKARAIARRIIDIPDDAGPLDLLSLPFIFSVDEIEDCGLHGKLLEAQKKMTEDVHRACEWLAPYGFDRNEIAAMAERKVKSHADTVKHVLFANGETS